MNKALMVAAISAALFTNAFAYTNVIVYSGQGLLADGFGGYDLNTELCGVANGADVDGPYLLWVLTASGAANADIAGPWGATLPMTKFGNGSFKYISAWYDPNILPGNVKASYDGKAKNVQLTISHGCRPFTHGAWCSPGFWKNAAVGAWDLVGESPSSLFDGKVYDVWFGASLPNTTLGTVLNNPTTYSGPPVPGTSGYPLNAFNATGAYLTSKIPGYTFSFDAMQNSTSDTCPIDHFGNWK